MERILSDDSMGVAGSVGMPCELSTEDLTVNLLFCERWLLLIAGSQHDPSMAQLLRNFLTLCSRENFSLGSQFSRTVNTDTVDIVMRRVQSWEFGIPSHIIHKYFAIGLNIATTAYQHIVSPEIQADIATYSALCVMFDDEVMGLQAMQMFPQRFYANAPQLHPSLDRLAEVLRVIGKHFPPFSANAIVINTMDFVNAELLLKDTSNMSLVTGSSAYLKYMRTKDGLDEAYAAFIFPSCPFNDNLAYIQAFPEIMECLHLINDILSHYKEMEDRETTAYVMNHAAVHQQSTSKSIRQLISHTAELIKRVGEVLGEGEALQAFESVVAGFAQYHLQTERYRLSEILPEYYPLDRAEII